jgi:hypothetical protein
MVIASFVNLVRQIYAVATTAGSRGERGLKPLTTIADGCGQCSCDKPFWYTCRLSLLTDWPTNSHSGCITSGNRSTKGQWPREVYGRLVDGIADSNPARGMYVCLLCLYVALSCVGRRLCDGLITRPEESYRVSNSVWLRNLKGGGQGPIWAVEPLDGWKAVIWHDPQLAPSSKAISVKFILMLSSHFLHSPPRGLSQKFYILMHYWNFSF